MKMRTRLEPDSKAANHRAFRLPLLAKRGEGRGEESDKILKITKRTHLGSFNFSVTTTSYDKNVSNQSEKRTHFPVSQLTPADPFTLKTARGK